MHGATSVADALAEAEVADDALAKAVAAPLSRVVALQATRGVGQAGRPRKAPGVVAVVAADGPRRPRVAPRRGAPLGQGGTYRGGRRRTCIPTAV